jgi:hypothetical protein
MSPIKEPNYFAPEIRLERFCDRMRPQVEADLRSLRTYLDGPMTAKRFGGMLAGWDDYLRLFANVKGQIAIGEASVCYLWSAAAAANIRKAIPSARIIMILRDPVQVAFSLYLHSLTAGALQDSFRAAIEASLAQQGGKLDICNPFLELGLYYEQVRRYLEAFPPGQIRIYLYQEYLAEPARVIADICRFLGVDPTFSPDMSEKHLEPRVPRLRRTGYLLKKYGVWQRAQRIVPAFLYPFARAATVKPRQSIELDSKDREYLLDFYRDDMIKLAALLRRDLSGWLRS